MAMTRNNNYKNDCIILNTIDNLVPENHLVRKLESAIDWNYIYPLVEELYSKAGRPSIDPVVLFKMIFINITFGINSMRKTCEEIQVNLAYRWFLGLSMDDSVPNYSTWSQNYIRRYNDSDVFDRIFEHILEEAINHKFVDVSSVFGDSTHQKANANKRKCTKKEVELTKKVYEDEMLEEINRVRKEHNQKPIETLTKMEYDFDEETGEQIEHKETKTIKESTTDPESGNYHKGEHEECFAYSHQTFCEKHGFVLTFETVPGNVHDSVSFFQAYDKLVKKFNNQIQNVCLDAGYITPAICKEVDSHNQNIILPYKRPMTKKGYFPKREYVYDEENDCYICPNAKLLFYTTTNKQGYTNYRSRSSDCENCPLKNQCTKSKQKLIQRHVWEKYREKAEETRHTPLWKEIYPLRKQTIERVFADTKENHGMRYTRLRGLQKNRHNASMIFSCHNLKRLAKWSWKAA